MTLPDFSRRDDRDERMEDPALSDDKLRHTLDAIEQISRLSGGVRPSKLGFERLTVDSPEHISILDVGTGNGAMLRDLTRWGQGRGIEIEGRGIDLLDTAIDQAKRQSTDYPDLSFACRDMFKIDDRRYDIVHASLVLHHFKGARALEALARMAKLSRLGVIINDLHRHPLHWLASRAVIRLITDNEIARHDGPLSVLRGFTRPELADLAGRAGLDDFDINWIFPFRWLMVIRTMVDDFATNER